MKKLFTKMILGSPIEPLVRKILNKPKFKFISSSSYWDSRYKKKGNSGAGSYGRLAEFKANELNEFVAQNDIQKVAEFGCGDGNQLLLSEYPSYIGVDISPTSINICNKLFKDDDSKTFFVTHESEKIEAELSLSLDVIYHLVEDETFERYMSDLFMSSSSFVAVYSSNYTDDYAGGAEHVRHRCFTDWVLQNASNFELIKKVPNLYPYKENNPNNTSLADFYFFKKN
ncbi:class I SAM-dependent methyltransferase [Planktomarina sp.]|nr:class I SAM-dependent methyltransferase [Planktomarina sp.]